MTLNLPKPIAAYFNADAKDHETVAFCFTEHAIVIDERKTYKGRNAITQWKAEASSQYQYVSEPFAVKNEGHRIIVTSRVSGNFPGSPVDLHYVFCLEGELISHLEITL